MASRGKEGEKRGGGEGWRGWYLLKLLWTLGDQSPKLFFKLLYCPFQPMLTYGSEVWVPIADNRIIEKFLYMLSKDY